jgi:invasion protein IalB
MKTFMKWSLLVLTATMASAAFAQDTTAPKTEEFPIGTDPELQPGQPYALETFGDWELLCVKVAEGTEPCEIGQLILDEQGAPVADVRVNPLPPGGAAIAGVTFVIPLGVVLQSGLIYAVDDKDPKQYPFQFCNTVGCVARVGLAPIELQAMRKGEVGKIAFRMITNSEQILKLEVSLKGFAAAYGALNKLKLEQQN